MRTLSLAEELEAVVASGSTARRGDILSRVTDLFIYDAQQVISGNSLFLQYLERTRKTLVANLLSLSHSGLPASLPATE